MPTTVETTVETMTSAAAAAASDDDAAELPTFVKRVPAPGRFDRRGLTFYMLFIAVYMMMTLEQRNSDTFFFAENSRSVCKWADFHRVQTMDEYRQWFARFVQSVGGVSVKRRPGSPFAMVGALRLRQVRATPAPCASRMMSRVLGPGEVECSDRALEAELPFGNYSGSAHVWSAAASTMEGDHYGREGWYSGGGYLVETLPLLNRSAAKASAGTDFLPQPHHMADVDGLWQSGWLDSRSKALFHDLTLYNADSDKYCNLRLLAEIGQHGVVVTSGNVRFISLTLSWWGVGLEVVFGAFLLALVLGNVQSMAVSYSNSTLVVFEKHVETRFQLELLELQEAAGRADAAFQARSADAMERLLTWLYRAPDARAHHIAKLNGIGANIPKLHATFVDRKRLQRMRGRSASEDRRKRKFPSLSSTLAAQKTLLKKLADPSLSRTARFVTGWRYGVRDFFRDAWHYVELTNLTIFILSFALRMKVIFGQVPGVVENVDAIPLGAVYTTYVHFHSLGYWMALQAYTNAFNAVLTWIKVFKYLNVFPQFTLLTRTLSIAATPLGIFFFIFAIVLVGSGQGFFLAFGLDVKGYRTLGDSISNVLRMAVGDFDYEALSSSQRFLGPVLFWMYIFLMVLVLMSMFIALLSEAYDMAREETPAVQEKGGVWDVLAGEGLAALNDMRSYGVASMATTSKNAMWAARASANSARTVGSSVSGVARRRLSVDMASGKIFENLKNIRVQNADKSLRGRLRKAARKLSKLCGCCLPTSVSPLGASANAPHSLKQLMALLAAEDSELGN